MAIRKVYAPYSTTGEQVGQTPLEGYVDVKQNIQPTILTGELGKDGEWSGVTVSDKQFTIDPVHEAVGNGGEVLSPQKADHEYIDMTGYTKIYIAIRPSNAGNVAIKAVMGPDTYHFANLTPVNSGENLRGSNPSETGNAISDLFSNAAESLTADVWNIFIIGATNNELIEQKLLQFKITNNSGGNSDITFAYLRVV